MTPLRQQMHDAMLVRGLAERTRQAYIETVARLAIFYHQPPRKPDSGTGRSLVTASDPRPQAVL